MFVWGHCHALAHLLGDAFQNVHQYLLQRHDGELGGSLASYLQQSVSISDPSKTVLSWKESKLLADDFSWSTGGVHPEIDELLLDVILLVRIFRNQASDSHESFIRRAAKARKLWKKLFPQHLPGFSYSPSVHVALDHLPAYAAHYGSEWGIVCNEEAGEKQHQQSQALWKHSLGVVCSPRRKLGFGAANILLAPVRLQLVEIFLNRFDDPEE